MIEIFLTIIIWLLSSMATFFIIKRFEGRWDYLYPEGQVVYWYVGLGPFTLYAILMVWLVYKECQLFDWLSEKFPLDKS